MLDVSYIAIISLYPAALLLQVRNFAMGGVPSFPNSVCMQDFFGADVDLIVWDFRMVSKQSRRRPR
jgi:hypothetical protein